MRQQAVPEGAPLRLHAIAGGVAVLLAPLLTLLVTAPAYAGATAGLGNPRLGSFTRPAIVPKTAQTPVPAPAVPVDDATHVEADKISGDTDREIVLEGQAQIRKGTTTIQGDKLTYDRDADLASGQGNVRIERDGNQFDGPDAQLRVDANEGFMNSPTYRFPKTGGHGQAERIEFLEKDRVEVERATYTTCTPDNMDWYFVAAQMELDNDRQEGSGRSGRLVFFDVPILATPFFSFPLNEERRSGLLPPTMGVNSRSGFDLTVPYYVNIAPNRDLTLYPRLLLRRGVQLGGEFRYLGQSYEGSISGEYLPNDMTLHRDRWLYSIKHHQDLSAVLPGLSAYANVSRVSDDAYPDDMGRSLATVVRRQYTQEGGVRYDMSNALGDWSVLARVQRFQTLKPNTPPYQREPQLNVSFSREDLHGFELRTEADFSRFRSGLGDSTVPEGTRAYLQQEISYPILAPGYFLTPKVKVNATQYELSHQLPGLDATVNRVLPTLSLDTGLVFERDAVGLSQLYGQKLIQTLEPRVFYTYTPFKDQSAIPLFDTAESDFNFAQIFADNPFVGYDRIADNNKVTAGLTTRLLQADTGIEQARLTVAQRFDLDGQRVALNSTTPAGDSRYSDLLVAASALLTNNLYADTAIQYNPDQGSVVRSSNSLSWRPEVRKVMNIGYRSRKANSGGIDNIPLKQVDLSGQWPVTHNLSVVGRTNYDLQQSRMIDVLGGLEYDACCWTGRFVVQRFTNALQRSTTQFYLQIEFKGLAKLGSNPIDVLKLNIPGYTPLLDPLRQ